MREVRDGSGSRRERLVRSLCATVDELSAHGDGKVVRLRGEAGIGKSTVADHIVEHGFGRGVNIYRAYCSHIEISNPLAPFESARSHAGARMYQRLRTMAVPSAGILRAGFPDADRFAMVDEIVEQTQAICRHPTLFVIEDLHWVDPASLHAITALARITLDHPLLLLLTNREGVANPALSHFVVDLDDRGAEVLEVEPLEPDEIHQLVSQLTGGSTSPALRLRAEGAGGNPFLVRELVDGLLAEGRTIESDRSGPDDLPERLRQAVGLELDRLGGPVRTLVQAAAVAGNRVQVRDLAAAMGVSSVAVSADVERAIEARLFIDHDGHLVFRHDLLRDAVYQQMPTSVRAATHRDLASALAKRGAAPALVASHLLLADGDRAETLQRLQEAASDTAALAPETALGFLDRARELAMNDLELRRTLENARLEALTAAGRLDEAENIAQWLLEVSPPEALGGLRARLAGLALIAGDGPRALGYVDQASAVAASETDRSKYLALGSMVCATNNDFVRAATMAEEAVEVGERAGATIGPSIALALLARMWTYGNNVETGLAFGSKAIALADADETGEAHAWMPCLHYGITALDIDRLRVADEMVQRGGVLAETHRMEWSVPLYGSLAASCHLRRGDLDEARAEAESSVLLAQQMRSRQALAWAQSIIALVAVECDDPGEARRWSDAAAETWASGVTSFGAEYVALAQARTLQIEGRTRDAFVSLSASWDRFTSYGMGFSHPTLATDLTMLAIELDEPEWVAKTVVAVESAATANRVTAVVAQAKWLRALRDRDRLAARAGHGLLLTTERRLEAAQWLAVAPELVADESEIEASLRAALTTFDEVGATRSAQLTRARLADPSPKHSEDRSLWDELTPTERDIVGLLAQGLTNAEIARRRGSSRRTVESHLGSVYRKLGIDGRVRLIVAAAAHFGTTEHTPPDDRD